VLAGNGFTTIDDNKVYYTVTGVLLCSGPVINALCYGNYIIVDNQLTIEKGAPVIEYIYNHNDKLFYIYMVKTLGNVTKTVMKPTNDN
jgi:hypothetical protein